MTDLTIEPNKTRIEVLSAHVFGDPHPQDEVEETCQWAVADKSPLMSRAGDRHRCRTREVVWYGGYHLCRQHQRKAAKLVVKYHEQVIGIAEEVNGLPTE